MKKSTVIIVVVLVVIICVAVYFSMRNRIAGGNKEITASTSQTSGLAAMDLGGILGSVFGKKSA